jgi:excisionase family DNA binding protein
MIPAERATIARRLLDIQEVATYTGLSVHTLYTMVSQRRIPFVKLGRLTKFDREEIDRWIAGHSVKVRRSFARIAPLTLGS